MLARFFRSTDAATLPYIALILLVLLGLIGLGYDFGRQFVMRSELQKAADAAAVAGAYQLDMAADQSTVATRVGEAVAGAAITANETRFANLPGDVEIASWRGLQDIPPNDDDPIGAGYEGPPYAYVEVTTEVSAQDFSFLRLFGGDSLTASATAVAGRGRAVCSITPMMICNPMESPSGGGGFDPAGYVGRQILAVSRGGQNAQWAPGNFGFLAVNDPGANALREALASVNGANQCYDVNGGVETEPGRMTQQTRRGINARFGEDPPSPSAENIQTYPRDASFDPVTRIGDGVWDHEAYWSAAHPGVPFPSSFLGSDPTRFEVYRYEIDNNMIPTEPPPGGEPPNGVPVHTPSGMQDDRRIITMAVLNCVEAELSGRQTMTAVSYLNAFITEPILDTPDDDFYFEIVGGSVAGNGGLVPVPARDWVEVVR
ncbi:hypothetical protein DDZ18_03045 [Marinicauda salina]|uniref:Putative Flp pilus-assembly TadG-like N-terminal domain-containing protein n=1 Tax=Marinicauda salina TaxID=2135793 RepID=A0A2U2BX57_9PROT|nr:pilus assembly protein TadG-related protein [Marinicauda salina]PWE18595.1 hypothetical protein DDZ18_03045 [Marinicauda salina]